MKQEIEARFVIEDNNKLFQAIKNNGFDFIKPDCLMKRYVYSIPGKGKEYYARVRDEGNCITATVKCVTSDTVDGVRESEIQVNSFDDAHEMFSLMGLKVKAYQETKRELWKKGNVELMIDTWLGLPQFIEIETDSEDVLKRTSETLGFDWDQASFGFIDTFYTKYLGWEKDEINIHPLITFENPPEYKL